MEKYKEPQIYIVNNREITERLSQNYIVATGDLGVAKTVEYEEYVNKRYVDLEYSMINNLHEYSVVIIDLQNENDTRHCLEDDEPDGIPYLFELSFPQKKFRPNQIDYAKNDERSLLTTWQLYNQYKLIENGIFTKKETRESLDKWGLISLLPKNLIRVGIYEEYFKKPKAGILTLNNVKLEVGKMIYAKKDGKRICTSIVSIQLNDKDVDQVDNGEVGIVTDIELEKGYEIFVKIE